MKWLGLDIGGANLKAADSSGWAQSRYFPLWRDPEGLSEAILALVSEAPPSDAWAVTMTGELCDCFRTKADGVRHILAAVQTVAAERAVSVFLVDGRFVSAEQACENPKLAAASNWRALAEFACRYVGDGAGLLIDVGSTTTDIIPIVGGRVAAMGQTDFERLRSRELVYTGVGRTPVCALLEAVPWRSTSCPLAAEFFSTTADAYVILGLISEDPHASWTADGRPLTQECARQRLARQVCEDAGELQPEDFTAIARAVQEAQERQLSAGIATVKAGLKELSPRVVISGAGEFLARAVLKNILPSGEIIDFRPLLGTEVSRAAPAYAVAMLASEIR
jgi:probable H4MPT-linked C1 transfer pathway protein